MILTVNFGSDFFLGGGPWRKQGRKIRGKFRHQNSLRNSQAILLKFAGPDKKSPQICSAEPRDQKLFPETKKNANNVFLKGILFNACLKASSVCRDPSLWCAPRITAVGRPEWWGGLHAPIVDGSTLSLMNHDGMRGGMCRFNSLVRHSMRTNKCKTKTMSI